jgi:hypothetical protein
MLIAGSQFATMVKRAATSVALVPRRTVSNSNALIARQLFPFLFSLHLRPAMITYRSAAFWILAVNAFLGAGYCRADETQSRGQAIYQKQCSQCHGAKGLGVAKKYAKPLVGDSTIAELAEEIADTMPKKTPKSCVGQDAVSVASYIYHTFYSRAARIKNRPPRIGLARLTGSQLRQSLADLYSHFDGIVTTGRETGLLGTYFEAARSRKKKFERVDSVLNFDFGNAGPGDGVNSKDFSIQWQGGVRADISGRYTIVIHSTCAFVCDFGRSGREFINNHVQSGDKTEFRRSVSLTAGRVYPVRIRFYQRKRKTEQPPAKISLGWIAPHGVEQVIPNSNLVSGPMPGVFALQTRLPPDDRSYGYERGISVDRQWDDSTTAAALEFAQVAEHELWPKYQRQRGKDSSKTRAILRDFLVKIAEVSFRGPLDDETRKFYVDAQVDATQDDAEAIKRSVLVTLKSPRFLYPLLDLDRDVSQQCANRLALTMFDSLPADQWLLQSVRKKTLDKEVRIRAAAERMVSDYRTRGKTRELMYAWLNLGHVDEIKKDEQRFPGFDEHLVADLRNSFDAFLENVIWSDDGDYRKLFNSDWVYTNKRLEEFYGETWKAALPGKGGAESFLSRSVGDANHRAGLLTHPYMMSGLAYRDSTSPVHRGVFLIRYILGRTLRPPSEAFTPLSPKLHPGLTTRQRVELQTSPASCQVCHVKINGLGFTLENYDAVGRYRLKDVNKPINSAGRYTTRSGKVVQFDGTKQLAQFLTTSEDAHQAFVARAFQHFVKQPIAAYGTDTLIKLTEDFKKNNFNIQKLLVDIAVIACTRPLTSK